MDTNFLSDTNAKAGTIGGTILVILMQLTGAELVKTIILAAVGALVSFTVSLVLKWLVKRYKNNK